ncbi:MAG: ABC transporter ATP-binding protein, partial [Firmicutes bacterium]|nr:ABC transporter ATP-binding protein [Bacillota bacterium]
TSVIGLFIAPVILSNIQAAVPLGRLLKTILLFVVGLMAVNAASSHVATNTLFGRIHVRLSIVSAMHRKIMLTSYPNTENEMFGKLEKKALDSVNSNSSAGEAIWNTLTDLLKNFAGFVIYLVLLAAINPVIFAVVLVTSAAGFFVSNHIYGWQYRHRDEETAYSRKMWYVADKATDQTIAKESAFSTCAVGWRTYM